MERTFTCGRARWSMLPRERLQRGEETGRGRGRGSRLRVKGVGDGGRACIWRGAERARHPDAGCLRRAGPHSRAARYLNPSAHRWLSTRCTTASRRPSPWGPASAVRRPTRERRAPCSVKSSAWPGQSKRRYWSEGRGQRQRGGNSSRKPSESMEATGCLTNCSATWRQEGISLQANKMN